MTTPSLLTKILCAAIALLASVEAVHAQATPARIARDAKADVTPTPNVAHANAAQPQSFVLHLPGIGGRRGLDRALVRGLTAGGFDATDTYDWTANDPGINALLAIERNHQQAKRVADMITDLVRKNPGVRVHVVAHSGGTGIAAWALEALPPDVRIYNLVLLASALSPDYDLSKALTRVDHRAYAFTSVNDSLILKVGTSLLGTIDGKKVPAAGWGGFVVPDGADKDQYRKFVQYPYDPAWLKYDNFGDHIGTMLTPFAQNVLAPLMIANVAPPKSPPTTRPVTKDGAKSGQARTTPAVENATK